MPSYSYSPSMASHMRLHEATTVTPSGWAAIQRLAAAGSGSSAGRPRNTQGHVRQHGHEQRAGRLGVQWPGPVGALCHLVMAQDQAAVATGKGPAAGHPAGQHVLRQQHGVPCHLAFPAPRHVLPAQQVLDRVRERLPGRSRTRWDRHGRHCGGRPGWTPWVPGSGRSRPACSEFDDQALCGHADLAAVTPFGRGPRRLRVSAGQQVRQQQAPGARFRGLPALLVCAGQGVP